jgi:hypothetical protein
MALHRSGILYPETLSLLLGPCQVQQSHPSALHGRHAHASSERCVSPLWRFGTELTSPCTDRVLIPFRASAHDFSFFSSFSASDEKATTSASIKSGETPVTDEAPASPSLKRKRVDSDTPDVPDADTDAASLASALHMLATEAAALALLSSLGLNPSAAPSDGTASHKFSWFGYMRPFP